ncbi:hypothetical protein [Nonomuraea monospora]
MTAAIFSILLLGSAAAAPAMAAPTAPQVAACTFQIPNIGICLIP